MGRERMHGAGPEEVKNATKIIHRLEELAAKLEDEAMDMGIDDFEEDDQIDDDDKDSDEASGELPDNFCTISATSDSLPDQLRGKEVVLRLKANEILYLPASWFHEVI